MKESLRIIDIQNFIQVWRKEKFDVDILRKQGWSIPKQLALHCSSIEDLSLFIVIGTTTYKR